MKAVIISAIIAAMLLLQGCTDKKQMKATELIVVPTYLQTVTVLSQQPAYSIVLPGELVAYEQVNIYPKIKGFVQKIYVDRGSRVSKGQLLAQLEAPEIGEHYAASKSTSGTAYQQYLFSKQAYYRLKKASQQNGAVASIEIERAYTRLLGDSAAYQSSKSVASASGQIKNYLSIKAPFDGVVTGRFISEGALVGDNNAATQPMFQLSQQNKLRLTVAIPEKQAQSLPAGTKASFTVVDFPGRIFTATLSRNSGALDISSRSLIAEFDVPNEGNGLRAGQYAKVSLLLMRSQPTLWVPATSIVNTQSGVFVIKSVNNISKHVPVQAGARKDSLVEVFGKLVEGDTLLLKGSEEIKEGININTK